MMRFRGPVLVHKPSFDIQITKLVKTRSFFHAVHTAFMQINLKSFLWLQVTTSYGCRTSAYVGLRGSAASGSNLHPSTGNSNQEHHHQLRMRRPLKLKCQLGIAKNSHASTAIKWACDRLGVDVSGSSTLTSEAILNGWTVTNREGHPPHILIVDCRAHKQLDVESIARQEPMYVFYLGFVKVHIF